MLSVLVTQIFVLIRDENVKCSCVGLHFGSGVYSVSVKEGKCFCECALMHTFSAYFEHASLTVAFCLVVYRLVIALISHCVQ